MRVTSARWFMPLVVIVGLVAGLLIGRVSGGLGGAGNLSQNAGQRGLTADEAAGALKAFTAPGKYDEYVMVSSGGQSGNLYLVGVPSMRLLKTIPVFTPESWSGYGQGADWSEKILDEGSSDKQARDLKWGDTHHRPVRDERRVTAASSTSTTVPMAGSIVDLRDFKTKQIVDLPNMQTDGGVFVTPNTDYVHISSMSPVPQTPDGYAPLDQYKEKYRGISSWMSIDQGTGKIDLAKSFQIELPPYTQDLADAGKLASDGFAFIGSYNTEMATGGIMEGKEPIEKGASARDFDYLHIIDWKKAAVVADAGKTELRNGIRVIPLQTAIDEGLLYLAPEPRSPHGADVSPDGNYIVVGGKLDPNVTIYDIELIKKAIATKDFDGNDEFGVPILKFKSVVAGQGAWARNPARSPFGPKQSRPAKAFRLLTTSGQHNTATWLTEIHRGPTAATWSPSTSGRSTASR